MDAQYALYETEREGMRAVVVLNTTALSFEDRERFAWQLDIVIRAKETRANGLPTAAERKVLDKLGDAIEAALGASNALFVARVTCDGQRELAFRVDDPEAANAVLQRATSELTARDWEFTMACDEDWEELEIYRSLAASCRN